MLPAGRARQNLAFLGPGRTPVNLWSFEGVLGATPCEIVMREKGFLTWLMRFE